MNNSQLREPGKIKTFLSQKIGVDPETIGSRAISSAIDRRMKACGARDELTYLRRLQTSPEELNGLIEFLVVPETWFFRHQESFNVLRDFVCSREASDRPNRIFRVLSVPCATGEEPYSIAIALMDAGLMASQIQIDAIDLSQAALTKAKLALFGRYSFREGYGPKRQYYFQSTPDGERVRDFVCRTVRFRHGNLLEPTCFRDRKSYDIIFCRNLLLYFNLSARSRALQMIQGLLDPQGLLLVGPTERECLTASGFSAYGIPQACAYQKSMRHPLVESEAQRPNPIDRASRIQKQKPTAQTSPTKTPKTDRSQSESPLDRARRLANWGELQDAISLCELYLKQNPISASAYVLLGEAYQARGYEERAEQCFQKALYLDPEAYISLVHLALLKEGCGDMAAAKVFRQRIDRLTQVCE